MNIAIRLFLGFFLVVGLAAWFVLNIFAGEVEPAVRQATEDTMVDTANILAELAAEDLAPGLKSTGRFELAVQRALQREPGALISGVNKDAVELRVYVTNDHGIVIFDSDGKSVGADYSQWHDVARVLHGQYGARSTRELPADPTTSVMYVAAPVVRQGTLIGVLSIAKPMTALAPYTERAREHVRHAGFVLLGVSALIGLVFTFWLTWSLNRLRDYAGAVANGEKAKLPAGGGRQLSELARALERMRKSLDGKQYVESYVQSLAHELKSPLSAVRGAAELLQESPSQLDALRFAGNIADQAERMEVIINRLLELARLEQLQTPEKVTEFAIGDLVNETIESRAAQVATSGLGVRIEGDTAGKISGDRFLLHQALSNLIDNALQFSPDGGEIRVSVTGDAAWHRISVVDDGPGAPDFALPHLFEKFYSLPRPASGRKSTGLGLPFVMEVAKLHGGRVDFANRPGGGAVACLTLPR